MAEFREKLRDLMDRHRIYSKADLVRCNIGVKSATIYRWLSDKEKKVPTLDQMGMVSRYFKVPLQYLMDDTIPVGEGIGPPPPEQAVERQDQEALIEEGRLLGFKQAAFVLGVVRRVGYEQSLARLLASEILPDDTTDDTPGTPPVSGGAEGDRHGVRVLGGNHDGRDVPPPDRGPLDGRRPPKARK